MARTKICGKPSLGRRWKLAAEGGVVYMPSRPQAPAQTKKRYTMAARRSAPGTGGMKLKRRLRPGTKALREIKRFQKEGGLLLHRAPFRRLVREIGYDCRWGGVMWGKHSVDALQEAAEAFLVRFFEDVNRYAIHAGRVTIQAKDVWLARNIIMGI